MIQFISGLSKIPPYTNSFFSMFRIEAPRMVYDNIPPKDVVFVCDYSGTIDIVDKSRKLFREEDSITIIDFEDLSKDNLTSKDVIIISNRKNFEIPELDSDTRVHTICLSFDHNYMQFKELAIKHNGIYNYVRSEDELPDAIGSVIGAVFSTLYMDVVIEMESPTLLFSDNKPMVCNQIKIGDIYADETKEIIIRCHKMKNKKSHTVNYKMTGKNILTGCNIDIKGTRFIEQGSGGIVNPEVEDRKNELKVVKLLEFYNTDVRSECKSLMGDINMLKDAEPPLFHRIVQEYREQRDNRSDKYVSKYYTPFRMWMSRELSKP